MHLSKTIKIHWKFLVENISHGNRKLKYSNWIKIIDGLLWLQMACGISWRDNKLQKLLKKNKEN